MGKRTFRPLACLLGAILLAGCPSRHAIRQPRDAYSASKVIITKDELDAAALLMKKEPGTPQAARGAYLLVRNAGDLRQFADMESNIAWLEKNQPASEWMAPSLYCRVLAARDSEGALRVLQRIDALLLKYPGDRELREACDRILPASLESAARSDLETFLSSAAADSPLAPDVMFTLGKMYRSKAENDEAMRILRKLTILYPAFPRMEEVFQILRELTRMYPVNPRVIGVIMPVSGRFGAYGESALNGIRLATEDVETSTGQKFEFAVEDAGEDPDQSVQALNRLFQGQQAIAVFGPLFSAPALACAAEANALGLIMLTPTALTQRLTQTGPYIFRMATTPEMQAQTLARFAVAEKKYRRFGILAPDNAYGRNMAAAFTSAVTALGATVLVESRFPPNTSDFGEPIVSLGGMDIAGFGEREEEYRRSAQGELESFLGKVFGSVGPYAPPPLSATVTGRDPFAPPPSTRIACIIASTDAFAGELATRLHAAALPHKSISVMPPESASTFSTRLVEAVAPTGGALSDAGEIALAELLGVYSTPRNAPLAIVIWVTSRAIGDTSETLDCTMALYDSATAREVASHRFNALRAIQLPGNRYMLEAVFIPAPGAQVIKVAPQLLYHDMKLPMLGSDSWNEPELVRRPEAIGVPAYFTAGFWPGQDRHITRQFVSRYQERYAAPPDTLSAHAYDGASLLMNAILRSDGTREGLRESLAGFGAFDGVTGSMRMGTSRDMEKDAILLEVNHDTILPVR